MVLKEPSGDCQGVFLFWAKIWVWLDRRYWIGCRYPHPELGGVRPPATQ